VNLLVLVAQGAEKNCVLEKGVAVIWISADGMCKVLSRFLSQRVAG